MLYDAATPRIREVNCVWHDLSGEFGSTRNSSCEECRSADYMNVIHSSPNFLSDSTNARESS